MNITCTDGPDGLTEEEAERWHNAVRLKVAQILLKNSKNAPDTEAKGPMRRFDMEIQVSTSGLEDPEVEGFTITITDRDTGAQYCEVLGPDGKIIKTSLPPRLTQ